MYPEWTRCYRQRFDDGFHRWSTGCSNRGPREPCRLRGPDPQSDRQDPPAWFADGHHRGLIVVLRADVDRLAPICATCLAAGRTTSVLVLSSVYESDSDEIREGILSCQADECRREHPIIDGVPIVVPDFRAWASYQLDEVLRRSDLSQPIASLLGDAAGPDSVLDRDRATLSSYAASHWEDFTLGSKPGRAASFPSVAAGALAACGAPQSALSWLDSGCSTGRATFEVAWRTGLHAAGVDLNFGALRFAHSLRTEGCARYLRRRVGLVYDECQVEVPPARNADVSFWCGDVTALPFPAQSFGGALSLNVLDSVGDPLGHLMELSRTLAAGAHCAIATPFDWSGQATPVEHWIGGHSQRGEAGGSSEAALRALLAVKREGIPLAFELIAEEDGIPWSLRTNERTSIQYLLAQFVVRRTQEFAGARTEV